MTRNNQKGFAHLGVILALVVLAGIAFVGFRVYEAQNQDTATEVPTQSQNQQAGPPEVNSAEDLEKAENYLKNEDIDKQLDTKEIDSALDE